MTSRRLFIGSYTSQRGEGIYSVSFDAARARFGPLVVAARTENPSFLAGSRDGRFLYSATESSRGAVTSFAIDGPGGALRRIGAASSGGEDPCYLSLAPGETCILVANYSSGSVAVLPLESPGRLLPPTQVIQYRGSGPVAGRQEGPHAHAVLPHKDLGIVFAADLGTDTLHAYRWEESRLEQVPALGRRCRPGSGPRHIAFVGERFYVVNELDNTVTVLRLTEAGQGLEEVGTVPLVSPSQAGESAAADIQASPDGRFVYATNRGEDTIVAFHVTESPPGLLLLQRMLTGGRGPRSFTLTPEGSHLLVANLESGNVRVFARDAASGRLTDTTVDLAVLSPAGLLFAPAAPGIP